VLAKRYLIERELGRGGMSTVYLAHDVRHDRRVALKVLNSELAATLGAERFLREIRFAARLQHPHILPLYDSGEVESTLYYVMPYVEGESLRARLTREATLSVEEAVDIATEVAEALAYAHARDVVHRDIKPENILLSGKHAVVADFGIARAVSRAAADKLTGTGHAVGTPAYMSPEQASGEEEVDGRSDVYALGCVLYEMLAGEPPFPGPTAQAIMAQHGSEPPPAVRLLRPAVPREVERAIETAMAKSPEDRFATAEQFAAALAPHATGMKAEAASLMELLFGDELRREAA
jgi:serine/threonine-protein kinase